jgi:hypothetical protein
MIICYLRYLKNQQKEEKTKHMIDYILLGVIIIGIAYKVIHKIIIE